MSTVATSLRSRITTRPRLAAAVALGVLVLVSTLVRGLLAANVAGPWIFVDELIYSELGRTAFSGTSIRGFPVSGYGHVYPLVIAPAYALVDDMVTSYTLVAWTNSLVMSLTAIPVFVIARTLMSRGWSLVAAALAVIVPGMGYTGLVMTESAFYPVFALAMMLIVLALGRPTVLRQALVFAAALLCFETRAQGGVIVPASMVSVVMLICLEVIHAGSGHRLAALGAGARRFWLTLVATVGAAVAGVVMVGFRGYEVSRLLGAYSVTAEETSRYQAKPIVSWFLLHVAEFDLWLGVVPFLAFLVLAGLALTRRVSPSERAFVAAALPMMLLMTVVVAAFVVFANVQRIEERNLFYIGILPLVALCWWASRRFDRPQPRWFIVALAASAMGPVMLPFASILTTSAVSNTFGVFVPYAIHSRLQEETLTTFIVALGVLCAVGLIVLVGDRRPAVVVLAVATFLVITALAVDRRTDKAAASAKAISAPQNWVDRAVGSDADVSALAMGGSDAMRFWQAEFFNRSVRSVLTIGTPLAGALPDIVVNVQPDGAVLDRPGNAVDPRYVLVDAFTAVDGEIVARDDAYGMRLVDTEGDLRVRATTAGIYGDGWSGPDVIYTRFACTGGTIVMEASVNASVHPTPVTVTPYQGETALPATQVDATVGSVPVRAALTPVDGVCQVRFNVSPLASPAVMIGSPDTRELGVIVRSFGFEPPA